MTSDLSNRLRVPMTTLTDRPSELQERRPARWSDRRLAFWVHVGTLVVGYLLIVGLLRGTWFRGDDFEFLANRVGQDRSLSIWMPHNDHWYSSQILIWRGLYAVFGVDSALPYLACSVLAHVLAVHFLWRLMGRAGLPAWLSTGLAAVFLFLGAGWENITWAFQLGFMAAFALGLAATLLCLRDGRWATVGALLLSVWALTFSGVAVAFAISSTVCLLLRRQARRAVVLAVVTGGIYLAWYARWGHLADPTPHTQPPLTRASAAPDWAWKLVVASLDALTSAAGLGAIVAIALAVWLVVRLRGGRARPIGRGRRGAVLTDGALVLAVLAANLVLQIGSMAVTRVDISPPASPRYEYFVIALLLPLAGSGLAALSRRIGPPVAVAVVAFLVITQGLMLVAAERQFEGPQLQADVVGLAALLDRNEPLADVKLATDLDVDTIQKWRDEGALDPGPVAQQTLVDARAVGQVTVVGRPETAALGRVQVDGQSLGVQPGACADAHVPPGETAASLTLSPGQTVSVTLRGPGTLTYEVAYRGLTSRPRSIPATVNAAQWLTVTAPLTVHVLSDAGQTITFCNPGPSAG